MGKAGCLSPRLICGLEPIKQGSRINPNSARFTRLDAFEESAHLAARVGQSKERTGGGEQVHEERKRIVDQSPGGNSRTSSIATTNSSSVGNNTVIIIRIIN